MIPISKRGIKCLVEYSNTLACMSFSLYPLNKYLLRGINKMIEFRFFAGNNVVVFSVFSFLDMIADYLFN